MKTTESNTPDMRYEYRKIWSTRIQRLVSWWEAYDVDDHPIICCLIAAATGLAWGWIFGANI